MTVSHRCWSLYLKKTFVFVFLVRVWNAFESSQNLMTFQMDQFLFFSSFACIRTYICCTLYMRMHYLFPLLCVYLLILNSLNLLQLSHRTSHASVCKIIHLEHFNRAQNIFVRKRFMLYLAMKRCNVRVCVRLHDSWKKSTWNEAK